MASTVPSLKPWYKRNRAAVAQMDRARASEARGREFESPQPHHFPYKSKVFGPRAVFKTKRLRGATGESAPVCWKPQLISCDRNPVPLSRHWRAWRKARVHLQV